MKKLSSLLKKVDFFEKLAIHGSRRNALKALYKSADSLADFNQYVQEARALASKAYEAMNGAYLELVDSTKAVYQIRKPTENLDLESLENYIARIKQFYEDISAQARTENNRSAQVDANLAYGTLKEALDKIKKAREVLPSYLENIDEPVVETSYVSFDNAPTPSKSKKVEYSYIDPSIQEELNKFLVTKMGKVRIITPDGKLGPQTRMSIEMIKKHLGMSGSSDTDVFNRVHTELVGMNPWEEMMAKKKPPSSTPEYDSKPGGIEEILKIENEPYMPDTI